MSGVVHVDASGKPIPEFCVKCGTEKSLSVHLCLSKDLEEEIAEQIFEVLWPWIRSEWDGSDRIMKDALNDSDDAAKKILALIRDDKR